MAHPKTQSLIERGKLPALTVDQAQANVKKALEDGLRKILSKIGISLLASYHGAQIFEAIGIGADLIQLAFRGTTSRVAGLSLTDLASETLVFHTKAYPELNRTKLEFMGFVQYRTGREVVKCSRRRFTTELYWMLGSLAWLNSPPQPKARTRNG